MDKICVCVCVSMRMCAFPCMSGLWKKIQWIIPSLWFNFFLFFNGYKLTHTCWWDVLLLLSIVQWRCIYKDFNLRILQSKMWPNFPEIQIVALRMHPCQFHSLGPGSTHSGSVSWGDCGRAFLDEKHVSSFCWWVPTLCLDSIVSQTLTSTIVYACFVRK